jgi:AraC-like DNA-binding protein
MAARVLQAQKLNFVSITNSASMVMTVDRGTKRLRHGGNELIIGEGEAVAIAAGENFDVENATPDQGLYSARWICFDDVLLGGNIPNHGDRAIIRCNLLGKLGVSGAEMFDRAFQVIQSSDEGDDLIAGHRVAEILVWLASRGLNFPPSGPGDIPARIRTMVESRPEHRWSSAEIAGKLAVSEATLRRRLSEKSVNLRAILTDVRMTSAMGLLQSTDMPVSEIASRLGYESQSRFAMRFRSRFGFPPSAIRGHQR